MTRFEAKPVAIKVDDTNHVSGLLIALAGAKACYVLEQRAGASMTHPFMTAAADGLAKRNVGTLRYQFPYMEKGGKRPDPPKLGASHRSRCRREGHPVPAGDTADCGR